MQAQSNTPETILPTSAPIVVNLQFVEPIKQHNYDKEVLEPLHKAQAQAAAVAEAARVAAEQKRIKDEADRLAALRTAQNASYAVYSIGELISGSLGYSLAWGNCVNEPGVNNPFNGSNPIGWPATSQTPWIGASALFFFNHVAVVTGFWSNGDIEVRQQNSPGAPHRYHRSMFRGFR